MSWGMGYGVHSDALGGDRYRVSAQLNEFNSGDDVQDYILLRSAETASEHGMAGFVIESQADQSRSRSTTMPGSSYTTATATAYGNSASGSGFTTYTPPTVITSHEPGARVTIRLTNDRATPDFRDAAEIIAAIGPRVHRAHAEKKP
jgi:hypothetical protein